MIHRHDDTNSSVNQPTANRSAEQLDNRLQPDPELAEGRASGGRMAMFGAAIVLILGVVFYGLMNNTSGPDKAATTAAQTSSPAPSTTAPNASSGTTTGAAPASPAQVGDKSTRSDVNQGLGGTSAPTR